MKGTPEMVSAADAATIAPEGFYNEINAIAQVLSYDGHNEPDILAMVAASAALTISGVPVGFRIYSPST